jgi:hypothetical protein
MNLTDHLLFALVAAPVAILWWDDYMEGKRREWEDKHGH